MSDKNEPHKWRLGRDEIKEICMEFAKHKTLSYVSENPDVSTKEIIETFLGTYDELKKELEAQNEKREKGVPFG